MPSPVNFSPDQPEKKRKGTYLPIVMLSVSPGRVICGCC